MANRICLARITFTNGGAALAGVLCVLEPSLATWRPLATAGDPTGDLLATQLATLLAIYWRLTVIHTSNHWRLAVLPFGPRL